MPSKVHYFMTIEATPNSQASINSNIPYSVATDLSEVNSSSESFVTKNTETKNFVHSIVDNIVNRSIQEGKLNRATNCLFHGQFKEALIHFKKVDHSLPNGSQEIDPQHLTTNIFIQYLTEMEYLFPDFYQFYESNWMTPFFEYATIRIEDSVNNDTTNKDCLNFLAIIFFEKQEYDTAASFFKETINYIDNKENKLNFCENICNLFLSKNLPEKSEAFIHLSINHLYNSDKSNYFDKKANSFLTKNIISLATLCFLKSTGIKKIIDNPKRDNCFDVLEYINQCFFKLFENNWFLEANTYASESLKLINFRPTAYTNLCNELYKATQRSTTMVMFDLFNNVNTRLTDYKSQTNHHNNKPMSNLIDMQNIQIFHGVLKLAIKEQENNIQNLLNTCDTEKFTNEERESLIGIFEDLSCQLRKKSQDILKKEVLIDNSDNETKIKNLFELGNAYLSDNDYQLAFQSYSKISQPSAEVRIKLAITSQKLAITWKHYAEEDQEKLKCIRSDAQQEKIKKLESQVKNFLSLSNSYFEQSLDYYQQLVPSLETTVLNDMTNQRMFELASSRLITLSNVILSNVTLSNVTLSNITKIDTVDTLKEEAQLLEPAVMTAHWDRYEKEGEKTLQFVSDANLLNLYREVVL